MHRTLVAVGLLAVVAAGCSGSSKAASPPITTAPTSASPAASTVAFDRRVCRVYKTFWDSDIAVDDASGATQAIEKALIDAAEATSDQALHDAVRGVIEGELGLPTFYLRDTAAKLRREESALASDARAALAEVEQNDRVVESTCQAVGEPIAG